MHLSSVLRNIFFLFCLLVSTSNTLFAQKQSTHILDIFYEALQASGTETYNPDLKGEAITFNNQTDEFFDQIVSPATIIERHPQAKKFLNAEGEMLIEATFELEGTIMGYDKDPKIKIENFIFANSFFVKLLLKKKGEHRQNEIFYGSNFTFKNLEVRGKGIIDVGGNYRMNIIKCDFDAFDIAIISPPTITIDSCTIKDLTFAFVKSDRISISNSHLNHCLFFGVEAGDFILANNVFEALEKNNLTEVNDSSSFFRREILGNELIKVDPQIYSINNFVIMGNHFESSSQNPIVQFDAAGNGVSITGNTFDATLNLNNRTQSKFEMLDNEFSSVSFMASLPQTPQHYVDIDWDDLKGKLMLKKDANTPSYLGKNELELGDLQKYNGLITSYRKLVEVFKNNGNTQDANSAYLEMKVLESERLKYVLKKDGGSDNLFRLKLHQLLSIYTRHGTNPAQAITASVWIMFFFSIIYFFFPSDWDKKSKPELLADYRRFVQKNEHGYFKPFLKLIMGFIISLFNAFVLSVNSFVTLGFGKIPTHGFAKYICILEGFLGWFLLSIFIVSLINQVLF